MTWTDIICGLILYVLVTWKLFELTNKYGAKASKWIIKETEKASKK